MVRVLALLCLFALIPAAAVNVMTLQQLSSMIHANHVPVHDALFAHVRRALDLPLEATRLQFPAMGVLRVRKETKHLPKDEKFSSDKIVFTAEAIEGGRVRFTNKLRTDPANKDAKDAASKQEAAAKQEAEADKQQEDAEKKRQDVAEKEKEASKQEGQPEKTDDGKHQASSGKQEGSATKQQQETAAANDASNQYAACMHDFERIQQDPQCQAIMKELKDMDTTNTADLDKMCTSACWDKVKAAADKAGRCLEAIDSPGDRGLQEKAAAKMLTKTVQVVCSKNDDTYCVTYFGQLMGSTDIKCAMWDEMGCCSTEVVDIAVMMSDMAGAGISEKDVVDSLRQKCPDFPDPLPAPCAACGMAVPTLLVLALSLFALFGAH